MQIALVLEGGGLRGIYTAGILDAMLDSKINYTNIYGVSAGAVFGVNYLSKQKGRVLRYNKNYAGDKRYMSFRSLFKTGNYINKEFAYYELPFKLDPFDEETYSKSKTNFYAVTTNMETGKAEYPKIINCSVQIEELRASSSLPFVSKPVIINNKKYLDGGIADSIPIEKALKDKNDKVVLVLTRPASYRKKVKKSIIPKIFYSKYPKLVELINTRSARYNKTLDKIEKLEKEGKIFVIRPSKLIKISRVEKNKDKIQEMYDLGVEDFNRVKKDLKAYLQQ